MMDEQIFNFKRTVHTLLKNAEEDGVHSPTKATHQGEQHHIELYFGKQNIVYEYLKTKIFSRDTNILPQIH